MKANDRSIVYTDNIFIIDHESECNFLGPPAVKKGILFLLSQGCLKLEGWMQKPLLTCHRLKTFTFFTREIIK